MANQVLLTFAGESKSLEDTYKRVGDGSKTMSDKVGGSSEGFKKAGEAADEVDTKAMGFRDTLTGVQDTMKGTAELAKGPSFEGFLTLGAGIGDLGSGLYNFVIPALEKTKIAMIAQNAWSKILAAGTKIWAGAQWLMNTALLASPITWIVIGIIALIAVIVLIATKTTWFQTAWKVAWGAIKVAAKAVGDWFKDTLWGKLIKPTWEAIKKGGETVWSWFKEAPGKLKAMFSKVAGYISAPFKTAFNYVADAWNNTIGRLSWSVPGWVPIIGGNTISAPHLPKYHSGGIVGGPPGSDQLAILQAGERVSSMTSSSGSQVIEIHSGGTALDDLLVEIISKAVRGRGGNVQVVLGGRNARSA